MWMCNILLSLHVCPLLYDMSCVYFVQKMKLEFQRSPTEQSQQRLEDSLKMLRRVENQLDSITQADAQVALFGSFSPRHLSSYYYYFYYYLLRIKCSTRKNIHHTNTAYKQNKQKGEMQSADKFTIKAKVMHVYVSTTVLVNNIEILRFISYCDSERELMPYLEATASILFSFYIAVANILTSRLSLTLAFFQNNNFLCSI